MSEREFTNFHYHEYLGEHQLMASKCQSCGELHLPPRPMCPDCYGETLEWAEMSGRGVLRAFTTIHIVPTAMIDAGYGRDNPYCTGIVQLDEGPSISAQILDVDMAHPEDIAIGTPLRASFLERGEDEEKNTFLAFRVVSG